MVLFVLDYYIFPKKCKYFKVSQQSHTFEIYQLGRIRIRILNDLKSRIRIQHKSFRIHNNCHIVRRNRHGIYVKLIQVFVLKDLFFKFTHNDDNQCRV
jgi:hypothetical protein